MVGGSVDITVEIPEELAGQLIAAGQDSASPALEAIALEGYRSGPAQRSRISQSAWRI
jgi:hypothetical protein